MSILNKLQSPPDVAKLASQRDVEGLIKALIYNKDKKKDKQWSKYCEIRRKAVYALGEIGDRRAVEPLIQALHDVNTVSEAAVSVLGKFGDQRAVEPLIHKLLDDKYKSEGYRLLLIESLGRLGDPRAVEPLNRLALKDFSYKVAEGAIEAISKIGGDQAYKALLSNLKHYSHTVVLSAIKGLEKLKDPSAIEPIAALATQTEDNDIYQASIKALEALGWKPGKDALAAKYFTMIGNTKRCVEVGSLAVPFLIPRLRSPISIVRRSSADILVKIYNSAKLDTDTKLLILNQRAAITSPHTDKSDYYHDDGISSDCTIHTDKSDYTKKYHTDRGIGVDFPE